MTLEELKAKIDKLPKWAQEVFGTLIQQVKDLTAARDKAEAALNGGKTSHIYIDGYSMQPNIYLPEDATVVFELHDGKHKRAISVGYAFPHEDRARLRVAGKWNQLSVFPQAANVIEVTEKE